MKCSSRESFITPMSCIRAQSDKCFVLFFNVTCTSQSAHVSHIRSDRNSLCQTWTLAPEQGTGSICQVRAQCFQCHAKMISKSVIDLTPQKHSSFMTSRSLSSHVNTNSQRKRNVVDADGAANNETQKVQGSRSTFPRIQTTPNPQITIPQSHFNAGITEHGDDTNK